MSSETNRKEGQVNLCFALWVPISSLCFRLFFPLILIVVIVTVNTQAVPVFPVLKLSSHFSLPTTGRIGLWHQAWLSFKNSQILLIFFQLDTNSLGSWMYSCSYFTFWVKYFWNHENYYCYCLVMGGKILQMHDIFCRMGFWIIRLSSRINQGSMWRKLFLHQ